ncbi:hypothetical protein OQA88_5802 [Cercophora sp. LCS_1]
MEYLPDDDDWSDDDPLPHIQPSPRRDVRTPRALISLSPESDVYVHPDRLGILSGLDSDSEESEIPSPAQLNQRSDTVESDSPRSQAFDDVNTRSNSAALSEDSLFVDQDDHIVENIVDRAARLERAANRARAIRRRHADLAGLNNVDAFRRRSQSGERAQRDPTPRAGRRRRRAGEGEDELVEMEVVASRPPLPALPRNSRTANWVNSQPNSRASANSRASGPARVPANAAVIDLTAEDDDGDEPEVVIISGPNRPRRQIPPRNPSRNSNNNLHRNNNNRTQTVIDLTEADDMDNGRPFEAMRARASYGLRGNNNNRNNQANNEDAANNDADVYVNRRAEHNPVHNNHNNGPGVGNAVHPIELLDDDDEEDDDLFGDNALVGMVRNVFMNGFHNVFGLLGRANPLDPDRLRGDAHGVNPAPLYPAVLNPVLNPLAENLPNFNYQANGYNNNADKEFKEPTPPAEGFGRNAGEDEYYVCAGCDEELAYDPALPPRQPEESPKKRRKTQHKEQPEHHFWLLKDCGHVYCNVCFVTRNKANETKFTQKTNPSGRSKRIVCAVDDCHIEAQGRSAWIGLFL